MSQGKRKKESKEVVSINLLSFDHEQYTHTLSQSLVDDVGTGYGGGSGAAEELSQLGTIQGMSCV